MPENENKYESVQPEPEQPENAPRENEPDIHDQPTLDMDDAVVADESPADAPAVSPKTLLGSGGLDPNPDFLDEDEDRTPDEPFDPRLFEQQNAPDTGSTVPHIVPFEHTMVHVPGENPPPPRQPRRPDAAQQSTIPAPPSVTTTQQNPRVPQAGYAPSYPVQAPAAPNAGLPPRRTPKPRRRILGLPLGCVMVFLGVMLAFCGGITAITLILTATLGTQLEEQLQAQVAQVDNYTNFQSTFYYDRNGALLYEDFDEGRRVNVNYADFPPELIYATIAIEDDSFFTNPGFEVQATTRAFLQYVGLSEGDSGGSTITQQLVRNVLFDYAYRAERSVQRKVEEILLAFLLTQRKPKEEILELYLNEIYYGNRAYGAEAAAQTFFGKSARELTLGEAALLAGLPQAPATLDPLNPDPAVQADVEARWRLVLDRMVEERFITPEERDQALRAGLRYNPPQESDLRAPHFTVYARDEFEALMRGEIGYAPDLIAAGGFRVYTTVDLELNNQIEAQANTQIAALQANNASNAAVLVLKPITGEILAMLGSVDYYNDAIDGRVNVTTAPRQPGSTMKPLTYAAALEAGMTPGDIIWDTPTDIAGYVPVNYDRRFHGPVRLRAALANSYNVPAVQTLRLIGVPTLLSIAERFGIDSLGTDASLYGLSLTLGGGEVTLLELTRAYTVFANGGTLVPSTSILCVIDRNDNIVYEYENSCPDGQATEETVERTGYGSQVLDPRIAYIISDILADNAARTPAMGANSPLNTGALPTSVKTGTTDDFRDNWTVGFTRNVAVGVWVGNSDGTPMSGNISGLAGAAPLWNAVINAIYNDQSVLREFAVDGQLQPDRLDQPSGMSLRQICDLSSLREPALTCDARTSEFFLDSPAAVPDGQGGLQIRPLPQPTQDQPPQSGVWLREIEPDIYQVRVNPLDPVIAAQQVSLIPPGQPAPPPPLYCIVPQELAATSPAAREQLFIAPPPEPADAVQAEQYARNNGFAILPSFTCSVEAMNAAPTVITAFISQPSPGATVTAGEPILGTASFTQQQALYWKLELTGGQFGSSWVTMNEVQYNSVVNGQLATIPGLQPGDYQIQLVVVGNDGNYVQQPYRVPFTVR